jgi:hypothetical protein
MGTRLPPLTEEVGCEIQVAVERRDPELVRKLGGAYYEVWMGGKVMNLIELTKMLQNRPHPLEIIAPKSQSAVGASVTNIVSERSGDARTHGKSRP